MQAIINSLAAAQEGDDLEVLVEQVSREKNEQVLIQCYELTDKVKSIVSFVKSADCTLPGYIEERACQVSVLDIYFVEAVDNKVFAYTTDKVYELKCKLYEFETQYERHSFIRCSKSFVVNLMKINFVRPALNGRLLATLLSGEEIIISRQYVPELKKRLLGDNQ